MSAAESAGAVEFEILAEARQELAHADNKAALILTALGVGAGATLGGFIAGSWTPASLNGINLLVWWSAVALAAAASAAAGSAVWPRTGNLDDVTSVMFWGQVSTFENVESLRDHLAQHPVDPAERTVDQLWYVSTVLKAKYRAVRWALALAAGSAVLFGLSGFLAL